MSVYESIMRGLNEAVAYAKGEGNARTVLRTADTSDDKEACEDPERSETRSQISNEYKKPQMKTQALVDS